MTDLQLTAELNSCDQNALWAALAEHYYEPGYEDDMFNIGVFGMYDGLSREQQINVLAKASGKATLAGKETK